MSAAISIFERALSVGRRIEFLEHKSDLAFAQPCALAVGKRGEIHPVDGDTSRVGPVSPPRDKRAWTCRCPKAHDRDELSLLHVEGDTAQGGSHYHFATDSFSQLPGFDEDRHSVKTISQAQSFIEPSTHRFRVSMIQ